MQPEVSELWADRMAKSTVFGVTQEITMAIDGQARLEKAELGAMPQMFASNKAMTTTSRQR